MDTPTVQGSSTFRIRLEPRGFEKASFVLERTTPTSAAARNPVTSGPSRAWKLRGLTHSTRPDHLCGRQRAGWPDVRNADGKPWYLSALNGTRRIQLAISELAAPIC